MNDEIKETNDLWVKIKENDIKEVLDYYKKDIENYEKRALNGYGISNKEAYQRYKNHKLILYHIANLQEKYERMKENAEILSNGYNELEKRKDKAIEYINTHYLNANEPELLNILNGGDE